MCIQEERAISEKDTEKYKARLVAKGYSQREGVDYNKIFSPVIKHTSIRIILAMVARYNLELEQLNVKMTFLHGDLEEDIYMSSSMSRRHSFMTTWRRTFTWLNQKASKK